MNNIFPNIVKAVWLGLVVATGYQPHIGSMVALGLTSSLLAFTEWINTVGVNDEIIKGLIQYRDAVNQRVSLTEEAVEGVAQATRHNTNQIATQAEAITRLNTAGNFKDLN